MSRRANGEGSIYRRTDGRWTGAAYVLRPDGGRVRRQIYGPTRGEVADRLASIQAKTAAGMPMAIEKWTVASYADHWLEQVAQERLRPSTFANYRYLLRLHILPVLGTVKLRSLSPAHVRALLSGKAKSGLSARTVQIIQATLRTILAEAVRDELVERNVAALVRGPSVQRSEVQPWSPEEAGQFLATTAGHRLHALFAVGVAIGLRRGELLGLRWVDVNLDQGVVRVRQTVQRLQGAGLVFGPPKTSRSQRTIPLPASSVQTLWVHQSCGLASGPRPVRDGASPGWCSRRPSAR